MPSDTDDFSNTSEQILQGFPEDQELPFAFSNTRDVLNQEVDGRWKKDAVKEASYRAFLLLNGVGRESDQVSTEDGFKTVKLHHNVQGWFLWLGGPEEPVLDVDDQPSDPDLPFSYQKVYLGLDEDVDTRWRKEAIRESALRLEQFMGRVGPTAQMSALSEGYRTIYQRHLIDGWHRTKLEMRRERRRP